MVKKRVVKKSIILVKFCILMIGLFVWLADGAFAGSSVGNDDQGFISNLSFIADFYYMQRNEVDEKIKDSAVPTFMEYANNAGVDERGFNVRYAEMALQSEIRSGFVFFGDVLFTPTSVVLEEIYLKAELANGLQSKIGRFLSDFGAVNNRHDHKQDFFEMPLLYWAFFGKNGLLENGVQVKWKIPVPFLLHIGVEVLEGDNKLSYGTEQFGSNDKEQGPNDRPNLFHGFIKSFINMNTIDVTWGFYMQNGDTRINNQLQSSTGSAIFGNTTIMGGNLAVTYYLDSLRYVQISGEFYYRNMAGTYYSAESNVTAESSFKRTNYGYYGQIIIKPFSYLKVGLRYESLTGTDTSDVYDAKSPSGTFRASGMVVGIINTFSQVRLQYNYDRTKNMATALPSGTEYAVINNHEIILQCTFALGKHGSFDYAK